MQVDLTIRELFYLTKRVGKSPKGEKFGVSGLNKKLYDAIPEGEVESLKKEWLSIEDESQPLPVCSMCRMTLHSQKKKARDLYEKKHKKNNGTKVQKGDVPPHAQ